MSVERPCSLLLFDASKVEVKVDELRKMLEKGDADTKIAALKKIVMCTVNGEKLPSLLLPIIQYAMPESNHTIKKLLLLYFESVEKTDPNTGKLRPEMILACNSLMRDLNHPSEYVCGSTLRLLCRLKEPEILDPLVGSVCKNLEHRHAYVRRNAVWSLFAIHKSFPNLIPNAPDLVFHFIQNEGDASCKRNALLMLYHCDPEKAMAYVDSVLDQVPNLSEILQLAVVEIVLKVCRANPVVRGRYLPCVVSLLSSSSPAVRFEAAGTLLSLSTAPTSVRQAALTYIDLLVSESDNNVKLVALDRVSDINSKTTGGAQVLQELVMDVLRALSCPTVDIRRRALEIALQLVTQRNVGEVIAHLKNELVAAGSSPEAAEYRQVIVQSIHQCAVRFPGVAAAVVDVVMDFLGDAASAGSSDVIAFVREAAETQPELRRTILTKLVDALPTIRISKVYRAALWIIGEYASEPEELTHAFNAIKDLLKDIPLLLAQKDPEEIKAEQEAAAPTPAPAAQQSAVRVLKDGTYATQAALPSDTAASASAAPAPGSCLRSILSDGDCLLGGIVGVTLTKLALKASALDAVPAEAKNRFNAEVLLLLAQLLRFGQTKRLVARLIDSDTRDRLALCINAIAGNAAAARKVLLSESRKAFAAILSENIAARKAADKNKPKEIEVQADDLIKIRLLAGLKADAGAGEDDDLSAFSRSDNEENAESRLSRVMQLTGYSDPLYCEAFVYVHQYDVVLDVVVVNQAPSTLQNVTLELSTLGDLRLVERPQPTTIASGATARLKASLKVSSTETGVIFGNLTYEPSGASVTQNAPDRNCVVLNEIRIDIMDYIAPATCQDVRFRQMWAEFEWENRIALAPTTTKTPVQYVEFIADSTNMAVLTPKPALEGDCGFLSANLYARSVFGEDALANISLEIEGGKVAGYVRIRSKTQGIALSLGEKITQKIRTSIV
eukprot:m51a1_g5927 Coatomer subunit beta (954) ;mRNA; r:72495-75856